MTTGLTRQVPIHSVYNCKTHLPPLHPDQRLSKSNPNKSTALTRSHHRKHHRTNNSKQIPCTTLHLASQPRKLGRRRCRPIPTNIATSTACSIIASQERRTRPIAERSSRRIRPVVSPVVIRRHRRADDVRYRAHAEIQTIGGAERGEVAAGVPGG